MRIQSKAKFEYLHGLLDPWKDKRAPGVTVMDAVEAYLEAQDVRASSRRCKKYRLTPFAESLPGMLVAGIREEDVRAFCYRKELKTATQQRYLYEMGQFLEFCRGEGWTGANVALELKKKTPRRKKRQARDLTEYLSPDELRSIVAKIEKDIAEHPRRAGRRVVVDVMHLAVATGLRLGELMNLRWSDVHLYEPPRRSRSGGKLYGWLSIRSTEGAETKTGDEDRVPVVPQAWRLLRELRSRKGESGYAFESVRGSKKLEGWWVSKHFRKYRRAAKIREEIHFHSLRHTCASWLAEQGVDLKVIQEVMRHSNIRQTMRYAHLIPEVVAEKMVSAFDGIDLAPAAYSAGGNRDVIGKTGRQEKSPYPQVLGAQGVTNKDFFGTAYGI